MGSIHFDMLRVTGDEKLSVSEDVKCELSWGGSEGRNAPVATAVHHTQGNHTSPHLNAFACLLFDFLDGFETLYRFPDNLGGH